MIAEELTVEQMNKDIADFMGFEHCARCENPDCYRIGALSYTPHQMKFATDWNWLMEVWFKIYSIGNIYFHTFSKSHQSFHIGVDHGRIEECYIAVCNFITWYKTQAK